MPICDSVVEGRGDVPHGRAQKDEEFEELQESLKKTSAWDVVKRMVGMWNVEGWGLVEGRNG
jgi:hypothetical protein